MALAGYSGNSYITIDQPDAAADKGYEYSSTDTWFIDTSGYFVMLGEGALTFHQGNEKIMKHKVKLGLGLGIGLGVPLLVALTVILAPYIAPYVVTYAAKLRGKGYERIATSEVDGMHEMGVVP